MKRKTESERTLCHVPCAHLTCLQKPRKKHLNDHRIWSLQNRDHFDGRSGFGTSSFALTEADDLFYCHPVPCRPITSYPLQVAAAWTWGWKKQVRSLRVSWFSLLRMCAMCVRRVCV